MGITQTTPGPDNVSIKKTADLLEQVLAEQKKTNALLEQLAKKGK